MTIASHLAQGVGAVAPTHSSHPQSLFTAHVQLILTSHVAAGALSRTNRTPRQQLQNKQAQQRYRERRKMKVTEMEQALAAMSQQVDELQGVLKQNVALQVQCSACICSCTGQTRQAHSVLHLRFGSLPALQLNLKQPVKLFAQPWHTQSICIHTTQQSKKL